MTPLSFFYSSLPLLFLSSLLFLSVSPSSSFSLFCCFSHSLTLSLSLIRRRCLVCSRRRWRRMWMRCPPHSPPSLLSLSSSTNASLAHSLAQTMIWSLSHQQQRASLSRRRRKGRRGKRSHQQRRRQVHRSAEAQQKHEPPRKLVEEEECMVGIYISVRHFTRFILHNSIHYHLTILTSTSHFICYYFKSLNTSYEVSFIR